MAESILLLRLEGPLQSWGTRSRWDVRDTGLEPTKSAVIGLLGCAKGLTRDDIELERLDEALLFGVRADRPGIVSVDYHTVTGYHRTAAGDYKVSGGTVKSLLKARECKESTIVSPRDYLHDAAFLVALTVKPEHQTNHPQLLHELAQALREPRWPLFLGRKACIPSRPFLDPNALTVEYANLEDALKKVHWAIPRSPRQRAFFEKRKQTVELQGWVEDPSGDHERQDAMRLNQLRFYGFRRCRRIEVPLSDVWKGDASCSTSPA